MASENLSDLPALPKSPIDATANATHNADERSEFPSTNNTKGKKTLAPEGDVVGPDTLAKSTPSKTATSILDSDEEGLSDPPPSSDGDDDERDMDFDPNELTSSSRKKLKPRERAAALAAGPRPDSDGEDEEEDTFPVRASRSKRKGKETEKRSHQKKSHKKTVSKKRNSDIFREDGEEAVVERADVKKPRRNTAVGLPGSRPLPASYDDCLDYDKMLLDMRDGGMTWESIRKRWYELTGEKTGNSTLPNRYSRIKANFIQIGDDDTARLIKAKQDVETSFEAGKWDLIAKHLVQLQGGTYKPSILRRHYQNIMAARNVGPPPGVIDKDFEFKDEDGDLADNEGASGVDDGAVEIMGGTEVVGGVEGGGAEATSGGVDATNCVDVGNAAGSENGIEGMNSADDAGGVQLGEAA